MYFPEEPPCAFIDGASSLFYMVLTQCHFYSVCSSHVSLAKGSLLPCLVSRGGSPSGCAPDGDSGLFEQTWLSDDDFNELFKNLDTRLLATVTETYNLIIIFLKL